MTAPFITMHDEGCALGDGPAPLVFNPEATTKGLVAVAVSRATRLRAQLLAWACAGNDDLTNVCTALEPLAEEVVLILEEMQERAARAGK